MSFYNYDEIKKQILETLRTFEDCLSKAEKVDKSDTK